MTNIITKAATRSTPIVNSLIAMGGTMYLFTNLEWAYAAEIALLVGAVTFVNALTDEGDD